MNHVSTSGESSPSANSPQRAPGGGDHRIGVTVLTGFLGSGKTTLLNRLVREPAFVDAVVIVNELGEIGVDHHLLRHAEGRIALIEGGCICCSVSGDLVNTLRELFMQALRRQIPRFRRVVIETTGLATPAPILYTLRHDAFISERYVHRGTVVVVDAQHLLDQLQSQSEVSQQIAAADVIVCAKADLVSAMDLAAVVQTAQSINSGAVIVVQRPDAPLAGELLQPALHGPSDADALQRWLAAAPAFATPRHAGVQQVSLALHHPLSRSAFVSGMARVQERHHESILRIKGIIGFENENVPYAVHGLHRALYPLEPLTRWPLGNDRSRLVAILRSRDPAAIVADLRQALNAAP